MGCFDYLVYAVGYVWAVFVWLVLVIVVGPNAVMLLHTILTMRSKEFADWPAPLFVVVWLALFCLGILVTVGCIAYLLLPVLGVAWLWSLSVVWGALAACLLLVFVLWLLFGGGWAARARSNFLTEIKSRRYKDY